MKIASLHRWLRRALWLTVLVAGGLVAWLVFRPAPQDLPWTPLQLDAPIGLFTGRKIVGLTADPPQCRALLARTGLAFESVPPHDGARDDGQCAVDDAVQLAPGDSRLSLSPTNVAPACPVAVGLLVWQRDIVQPAAREHLGSRVARIRHFGSYSCRRLYGRSSGAWSEHATADAIDVAGFVLEDGRTISIAGDWADEGEKGAFLRAVRDGACKLFATVLSPDYNAQHHDHFHLDQAERGEMGWRACR